MDFSAGIEFFFGQLGKLLFSLGSHFSLTSLGAALIFSARFLRLAAHQARPPAALAHHLCARCFPSASSPANRTRPTSAICSSTSSCSAWCSAGRCCPISSSRTASSPAWSRSFGPVTPSTLSPYVTRSIITVMLFLSYELGYWFNHWLSHKVPLLWEFHKVHHTAEVLTPLTNFRVHPVYTWIFANILAFSAAIANGLGNYMFGDTAYQYALSDTNIILVLFIHTYVHLQHSHMWISFRGVLGRIFVSPAHHQVHHSGQSEALQQEFRQLPGAVGLDVRHALRAGKKEREPLAFGFQNHPRRAHLQGRAGQSADQRRRPSQAVVAESALCPPSGCRASTPSPVAARCASAPSPSTTRCSTATATR